MKDLRSEVLLRKRFCSEKCSTNEEVVAVFGGLLSVLSKAKKQRSIDTLASVFSDAIMAEANEIAECNALKEVDIGEVDADTGKSGKLDKVDDDCLRLSLGFLSVSDRMENIELTCRRLFHASRSVSYGIEDFDVAVDQLKASESRLVALARRLQCTEFNSTGLLNTHTPTLRKCVEAMRPNLRNLTIDSRLLSLLSLSFPRLTYVDVVTVPMSKLDSFFAFLLRHPSLQRISTDLPLSTELLTTACECPSVRRLDVGCVNIDMTAAVAGVNIKKITCFRVNRCSDLSLLKPLLHNETKALRVSNDRGNDNPLSGYSDTTVYSEPLHLPNLTQLSVSFESRAAMASLKLKAPKLVSFSCVTSLLDLDKCLHLCPFGTLYVTLKIDAFNSLEVSLLCSRLMDVFTDKDNFKHKRLKLTILEPTERRWLASVRDFVPFFIVAEKFIAPTVVELAVARATQSYLQSHLGAEAMDKLKQIVKVTIL